MNTILRLFQQTNRCDWYVFFWCIYQLQEILYPPGIINQGIQVLIMAWAIYESGMYMLPQRGLPLMIQAASLLMYMFSIYGLIFILSNDFYSEPSSYLKSFVNSFLPLFLFYKYSKDGYIDENRMRIYFIIFLCIIIPQYFHAQYQLLTELKRKGSDRTEDTNNIGYLFVSLFPMLFFWYHNRWVQYGALCVILLFVLMGMKRGAIVIAALCTIWFLWNNIKNANSRKQKYHTVTFGITMVIIAMVAVSYQMATSQYFQQRIEATKEGNSSGRDGIYSSIMDLIVNDNSYVHLFVGRGAFSTMREIHKAAHQDWLQTMCDTGLLGIVVLSFFFFAFYKTARDSQRVARPEYKVCMMMLFFASFTKTFFSISLQNMPIYVTMPIAYLTYHTYHSKNNFLEDKA